jgi:glycosyltransferase involved in cell wall biosynthesis
MTSSGDREVPGCAAARRVALVLASSTGGIGRHVASLAAGLVAGGGEVRVFGPAATEELFGFTGLGAGFTAVEMPTGDRGAAGPGPGGAPGAAAAGPQPGAVPGGPDSGTIPEAPDSGAVPASPGRGAVPAADEARAVPGGPGEARRPAPAAGGAAGTRAAVRALRRELAAWRPDLVHAHGLRAGLVADLARRRPPLPNGSLRDAYPLVVTWHNAVQGGGAAPAGRTVRGQVLRLTERLVARGADVTLGASADLVDRARGLGARDARLVEIAAPVHPPATTDRNRVREELGAAPDQPLVLSVGRLHPQKGYDILIAAAARWRGRTPPPVVVIAGSGPDYLALAGQASDARAPVQLVGHRADVADLLAAADLAVVSSVWEARQFFAQEALRAGVPLVATDVGGLAGLVGEAAVLIPAGSVDALDAAVLRLLDDEPRRRELAERGRARAAQWPTEEQTVAEVSRVYADLVGRRVPVAEV